MASVAVDQYWRFVPSVTDGVYQIRNLDLSNMTIMEGKEGITVIDPLVSAETAKVEWTFIIRIAVKDPLLPSFIRTAMLTTHGGVRGVIDEADVKSGKVKVYAPAGFYEGSCI